MEGRGGVGSSNQYLKICSASGKEGKHNAGRKFIVSPLAGLSAHTYITRLKIVTSGIEDEEERQVVLEEDYSHLLGHCGQHPSTLARLSDLPDHVISLILCSLPLNEAVRTSILSKRWRYLWSFMPNLSLPEFAPVDVITNILKRFKSPYLGCLCLDVLEVHGRFPTSDEIDSWLSLACSHRIEDLELRLHFLDAITCRPCVPRVKHLFTLDHVSLGFSTLKRLTLRYCMVGPPASKHLTSLEYLALGKVLLDDNTVEELTSSCPMLGELELRDCNSNTPLRIFITNPKTSKLTIYDVTIGRPDSLPVLELCAPYLSTLVVVSEVGRRYELKVPSLSTLKLANFWKTIYFEHEKAALSKILSGLNTREVYFCSPVLRSLGRGCVREGLVLAPPMKVKRLHLQIREFPQEFSGLVYSLNFCDGIETLVLDFENMNANQERNQIEHLWFLDTTASKDIDPLMIKDKEKLVYSDDENSWSSLRILLSCLMPDLKCIVINGFKRVLHKFVGEEYSSCDFGAEACHIAVDKYEFTLLRLFLNYSLGLEMISIRTKDVYLIEEADEMGMETMISPVNCQSIYLDPQVDKMEIPQWNKVLLSLPRCSPRVKIIVANG